MLMVLIQIKLLNWIDQINKDLNMIYIKFEKER